MATPVRRVARAYHHTRPEVRNTALAHPENNCEYDIEAPSQASGYPENHSGSPTVLSESSGTKSDGPRKRSPMRLPGSPRPEEADIGNRLPLNPVDAKHNTTPFLDDLSVYDQYLRQRLRNSSEEFEEFKEHILHINASVFNWSVTSYQFFWSVSWYIITCAPRVFTVNVVVPWSLQVGTMVSAFRHGAVAWILSILDIILHTALERT